MPHSPIPMLLTVAVLGLCFLGNDLGDGTLGDTSPPYIAQPLCAEYEDMPIASGTAQRTTGYKPCNQ